MSSSNSPCAACKFQRRKCTQECVFAPYFPPDQPQKFENVHKVFGASNVSKILNELNPTQREDAVNSLAYEAEARLRDPVYGCVGLISVLQHKLVQVQSDLYSAKKELATYLGPQAMLPITPPSSFLPQQFQGNPSSSSSSILPYNVSTMLGNSQSGHMLMRDSHHQHPNQTQQQILEAQQLAAGLAAREQQDMVRGFEVPKQLFNHHEQQHQQAHDLLRFNGGGYDPTTVSSVTAAGMSQMGGVVSPSLALGNFDSPYPSHQLAAQLLLSPQQTQVQQLGHQSQQPHHEQKSEGEEDRNVGPSG